MKTLKGLLKKKLELVSNRSLIVNTKEIDSLNGEMIDIMRKIRSKKFERDVNTLYNLKQSKGKSAAILRLKENFWVEKITYLNP